MPRISSRGNRELPNYNEAQLGYGLSDESEGEYVTAKAASRVEDGESCLVLHLPLSGALELTSDCDARRRRFVCRTRGCHRRSVHAQEVSGAL